MIIWGVVSNYLHWTRCPKSRESYISRGKSYPPWKWNTMNPPTSSMYKGPIFIQLPHSRLGNRKTLVYVESWRKDNSQITECSFNSWKYPKKTTDKSLNWRCTLITTRKKKIFWQAKDFRAFSVAIGETPLLTNMQVSKGTFLIKRRKVKPETRIWVRPNFTHWHQYAGIRPGILPLLNQREEFRSLIRSWTSIFFKAIQKEPPLTLNWMLQSMTFLFFSKVRIYMFG